MHKRRAIVFVSDVQTSLVGWSESTPKYTAAAVGASAISIFRLTRDCFFPRKIAPYGIRFTVDLVTMPIMIGLPTGFALSINPIWPFDIPKLISVVSSTSSPLVRLRYLISSVCVSWHELSVIGKSKMSWMKNQFGSRPTQMDLFDDTNARTARMYARDVSAQ